MSDLQALAAYHAETYTARVEDAAAQPPVIRIPATSALLARIRAFEARLEALETWKRAVEREQDGGK